MKNDAFLLKVDCSLGITSQEIFPSEITKELGIQPDRSFVKGDYRKEGRDTIYTRPHHLWQIRSKVTIDIEGNVSAHISEIHSRIKNKLNILGRYKKTPKLDLVVWVSIKTDDAGGDFYITEEDLAFINSISNRFQFSLITSQNLSLT